MTSATLSLPGRSVGFVQLVPPSLPYLPAVALGRLNPIALHNAPFLMAKSA